MIEQLEPRVLCYALASNGRWSYTAEQGYTGSAGHYATVTWSIVPDGTVQASAFGEANAGSTLRAKLASAFGSFDNGRKLIQDALTSWSKVSGVEFKYEPHDDGASGVYFAQGQVGVRGDVRIGAHSFGGVYGVLGGTFFPPSGDMILDSADFGTGGAFLDTYYPNHLIFFNTVAHEGGHAIGLDHDNTYQAVMNSALNVNIRGPQADDINGAKALYGNAPLAGDANRDGVVNVLDYGWMDYATSCGLYGWSCGDFNYDGKVDVLDYGIIDAAMGH